MAIQPKIVDQVMRGNVTVDNCKDYNVDASIVMQIDEGKTYPNSHFDRKGGLEYPHRFPLNVTQLGMLKYLLNYFSIRVIEDYTHVTRSTLQHISVGNYASGIRTIPCSLRDFITYHNNRIMELGKQ